MLISRLIWVIYSKIKKSFFEENARKWKSVTFNKFTSHWKSLICGFIPLLCWQCCVKSKCDIYQIHWKMRKNIPFCIRFLKGIFVMLHTAVQVPVWCTGQSNILWCLCIMLPEQTSKPIACPKKLLAFASFKILVIIIENALEISQFCTSLLDN